MKKQAEGVILKLQRKTAHKNENMQTKNIVKLGIAMLIQSITHWKLAGFWPNVAEFKRGMELGNTLEATVGYMDAEVPGNVYKALMDHGYIADPYIDMNSLSCEWVANREWVYKTSLWIDSCLLYTSDAADEL